MYWHAFTSVFLNNRSYYWEAIKDQGGFRILSNPDSVDCKIGFAPYLAELDVAIDVPARTKATYCIKVWGIDGTTQINGVNSDNVKIGTNDSQIALRQLVSDSDFKGFLQLSTRMAAPKNLKLSENGTPPPGTRVIIEWDAVPGAYGYYTYLRVHDSGNPFEGFPMGVTDPSTHIIYLTPGTTYDMYVVADDGLGNISYPSETITVTTSVE